MEQLDDFVPLLCATPSAALELALSPEGSQVLEASRHVGRKVVLFAVLQADFARATSPQDVRGLFISSKSVHLQDDDAVVLACTLRNVDLASEPYWGALLLLLCSHVVFASPGAISTASFAPLEFLAEFLQWRVLESSDNEEQNVLLLKELLPRFTWAAIDLKIKEMEGQETPTKYFEYKLETPQPMSAGADAQMMALEFFTRRDCIVLKSNALTTPAGYATPQAFTSSKILPHVLENVYMKPLFGRYLSGGLLLHLVRSVAHVISTKTPMVLQRVVKNVQLNYWKLLLESALKEYKDRMHAYLTVYEPVEFTSDYLVDITERKLQSAHASVVDAGQGEFSAFDEFGNLKRQAAPSNKAKEESGSEAKLNTGIFTFIKDRAGKAFSRRFSSLSVATPTPSTDVDVDVDIDSLGQIGEDQEAYMEDQMRAQSLETPSDILAKYNAPIRAYRVPMQYFNAKSECMPVDNSVLESIHEDALNEAKAIVQAFLYDLRCSNVAYSELGCFIDFRVGKKNLSRAVQRVKQRFLLANEAASTLFCAQLVSFLHSVVLRKNETDRDAQQSSVSRGGRSMSVILPEAGAQDTAPLTKLPFELMAYKTNLEAMISQYNFVSRGPMAQRVLIQFFQVVVRKRLLDLTLHEYSRFERVCDGKFNKLSQLEETLEDTQRHLMGCKQGDQQLQQQEAQLIAQIQARHRGEITRIEQAMASVHARIESALRDQQALYQRTMQATRKTIDTVEQVSVKNRVFKGYLERYESGRVFSKRWRQFFYVLDNATLTCYRSKSDYEERGAPCERPLRLTGFKVVKSVSDESKIKLLPPTGGEKLRFRAPASVGRETWMKKLYEASQITNP